MIIKTAKKVIKDEMISLELLANNFPKDFEQIISEIYNSKGRVIISGIGKSGYIGQKISASLSSTGTRSFYIHPAEASHGDLGMIDENDIVILLSNSGETKELFDIINYCKRFSIKLIGMTMREDSILALNSDYLLNIPVVKEASVIDAPTSSTTMMLALGDAIMVSLCELRGFTKDDFKIYHPGGKLGSQMLKISDLMHKLDKTPTCGHATLMSEVLIIISKKGFGCCAVLDDNGDLYGIITDGDLRRHMSEDLVKQNAKDVMTFYPKTISPEMLASEALAIMSDLNISSLLVCSGNELKGIIHIHDLLRAGVK